MLGNDLKRFDILDGQIRRAYEFDDGRWEPERLDVGETYRLSGQDVLQTELDDGWQVTTVYRDVGGSGIYREVSSRHSPLSGGPLPVAGGYDGDSKRFDISGDRILGVYEFDDGRWQPERIDGNDSYCLSGDDVVHVELDDGWQETTIYRDLDGSGVYREVSIVHGRPGESVTPLSPEPLDQGLARLYLAVFDRLPDLAGLRYWVQQREQGMSLSSVADSFLKSDEFVQTYGGLDDTRFIDLLYLNVLGRSADRDGQAWWAEQLDSQVLSREAIVVGFSESAEFVALSRGQLENFVHVVGQPMLTEYLY